MFERRRDRRDAVVLYWCDWHLGLDDLGQHPAPRQDGACARCSLSGQPKQKSEARLWRSKIAKPCSEQHVDKSLQSGGWQGRGGSNEKSEHSLVRLSRFECFWSLQRELPNCTACLLHGLSPPLSALLPLSASKAFNWLLTGLQISRFGFESPLKRHSATQPVAEGAGLRPSQSLPRQMLEATVRQLEALAM